jgi:replicative DNA helicase
MYSLAVTGKPDVERFFRQVGSVGGRKVEEHHRIANRLGAVTAKTNRDTIPAEAWRSIVVPAMTEAGMTARELSAAIGVAYSGGGLYRGGLSRKRALRVAGAVCSETLADLATSDVYWDEILSIDSAGEEDVFDLTVEGLHNFVAEDIVLHNSIEQDADLVMFVYRDEYYNEESDQQGLAEIILSKHRNGPTGVEKLSFLKRYAKFADLAS